MTIIIEIVIYVIIFTGVSFSLHCRIKFKYNDSRNL